MVWILHQLTPYLIHIKIYTINITRQFTTISYRIVDSLVNGMDRKPTDDMDAIATSETENMIKQSDVDANNFDRNLIFIEIIGFILIILFTTLIIFTYKGITMFIEQFKTLLKQAECNF